MLVMSARIGPRRPVRVFLRQWREHYGLTLETVGGRFEPPVEKGTVSRWEKAADQNKVGSLHVSVVAAYAEALNRPVTDMYRLPPKDDTAPSLDAIAAGLPDDLREQAVNVVSALARRKTAS